MSLQFGKDEYGLLVSHQLVGTTLSLFCRCALFPFIRNVEVAKKMTGFGGITGNKGSVAVFCDIMQTSFCFISSHLAAGTYLLYFNSNELSQDKITYPIEIMTGNRHF